ncbi:MAG: glycogen synthase GlgA [Sporomusaceae bacterium]|jgi:starch synthase|nr:glycogen synthase GlgA [Sporomusaceae bacterium]
MKNILFVASEATPFAKTGGLGDVIGSLPKELACLDDDVQISVILPKYKDIPEELQTKMEYVTNIMTVWIGWRGQYCGLFKLEYGGVTWYFIDNKYYFDRNGFYGYYDDAERFAFFCHGVLSMLPHLDTMPDIIHCHDWQSAAIPALLKYSYRHLIGYEKIRTIQTIHNLAYQGVFPKSVLKDLLGLDFEAFNSDGLEFFDNVNFLKGGIAFADIVTTVSKSYSQEIQEPYFGEKLDGLLHFRNEDLYGIVNGLDYNAYDPARDSEIFLNYTWRATTKRLENKARLQELLNLPVNKNIPVIGIVSRLVEAKGFDLIAHVLNEILVKDVQVILLGAGDYHYEHFFREASYRYPEKLSANIAFTESLARKIYAGSDMFLMPSKFEPCGIGQLIAMRYGSLPIVREVGGLKDTVSPYDKISGEGTGFTFQNYNAHEMLAAIDQALEFYNEKTIWSKMMKSAMRADFSWKNSAEEYLKIYDKLKNGVITQPETVVINEREAEAQIAFAQQAATKTKKKRQTGKK